MPKGRGEHGQIAGVRPDATVRLQGQSQFWWWSTQGQPACGRLAHVLRKCDVEGRTDPAHRVGMRRMEACAGQPHGPAAFEQHSVKSVRRGAMAQQRMAGNSFGQIAGIVAHRLRNLPADGLDCRVGVEQKVSVGLRAAAHRLFGIGRAQAVQAAQHLCQACKVPGVDRKVYRARKAGIAIQPCGFGIAQQAPAQPGIRPEHSCCRPLKVRKHNLLGLCRQPQSQQVAHPAKVGTRISSDGMGGKTRRHRIAGIAAFAGQEDLGKVDRLHQAEPGLRCFQDGAGAIPLLLRGVLVDPAEMQAKVVGLCGNGLGE